MTILDATSQDPSIRFEGLVKAAFNCGHREDPWKTYANHSFYDRCITEPTPLEFKRGFSTVLVKIIGDYYKEIEMTDLIQLEKAIWNCKTQSEVREILDSTIEFCKRVWIQE